MKQTQINNYRKSSSITLLLRRLLESLGLYSKLKIPTSLGRRSSVVILALIALTITSLSLVVHPVLATAPTITISLPSTPLKLTILPSSDDGTFASSNDLNFTVTTDNYTGYQLSIAASTSGANATSLVSGNNTIATLPAGSSLSENDFRNGANYINKWGYLPSKLNSVSNTTYRPAPDSSGTLLDNRSSAGTNIAYTISIGAKVATSQPLGDYSNTFVITAVANLTNYSITYVANDGASGADTTNMPSTNPQVGSVDTSTNTITLASAPSRTGYTFMGWCTVQVADDAACSGTEYPAGGTYTIDYTGGNNTFSLYARWEELPPYMQDFTVAECQAKATSAPKVVYDRRDGSDYTVRYINDACWMTQNLRITKSTGQADWTISSTDSNFSTNSTWNIHVSDLTASNSYTEARSHLADASTVADAKNNGYTITTEEQGAWYNYCAASAGTVCAQTKTDATEDICPAGWHLPSYNTTPSAFSSMIGTVTLPDGTNAASLFSPVYGGFYSGGTLYYSDSYGVWWSSTASTTNGQYSLYYLNGSLYTVNRNKYLGLYVRCVRTPEYMQDQTASTLAAKMPNVGDTTTLYDKRDNQPYEIGKLADGKYWMLEPLNLAGGTTLTSANTDVTDTYISGFTTSGNLTKNGNSITLPASATKNTDDNNLTDSTQFSDKANAYVFNSGNKTNCGARGQNVPCYSYYSWIATTLGGKQANGSTAVAKYNNAAASICPKGWRLPTSTTSNANAQSDNNWETGDWYALATAYGASLGAYFYQNAATFYNNAGPGTTPNFLLAGSYANGSFSNGGNNGYYWSATLGIASLASRLYVGSRYVSSADYGDRYNGLSVRCLFRSN